MKIRKAKPEDIPEVVALLHPMWLEHASKEPELLDRTYIENYDVANYCHRAIEDPNQEMFVADDNGKIVGVSRVEVEKSPGMYGVDRLAFFDDLVIDPDFRHQGLAGKLIDTRIKYVKEKGIKICYSKIYSFNTPAQNLMKKHGFKDTYHHYYKFL